MMKETYSFNTVATAANQGSPIVVVDVTTLTTALRATPNIRVHSIACELDWLKCLSEINSLQPAALPAIALTDTEEMIAAKVASAVWGGARIHLNLLSSGATGNQWSLLGKVALQRVTGFPYSEIDLLKVGYGDKTALLSRDARLAIQVENAGFGQLGSNDRITVHGQVTVEIDERLL